MKKVISFVLLALVFSMLMPQVQKAEAQVAPANIQPRTIKLAVLTFKFTTDPYAGTPYGPQVTPAELKQIVFDNPDSIANYFKEVSGGAVTVTGEVIGNTTFQINYPAPTIPATAQGYSQCYDMLEFTYATALFKAATKVGFNYKNYDGVYIVYPYIKNCTGGVEFLYTNKVFAASDYKNKDGRVHLRDLGVHEFGHSLGLSHSGLLRCTENGKEVSVSQTCTTRGFADKEPLDPMGISMNHFNAFNKSLLFGNSLNQYVSASGVYNIAPVSNVKNKIALVIPAKHPQGNQYFVEYRVPFGTFDNFPSNSPYVNGMQIRLTGPASKVDVNEPRSRLVKNMSTGDFSFRVNQSFKDPNSNIVVKLISLSSTEAKICVGVNSTSYCDAFGEPAPVYSTSSIVNSASYTPSLSKHGLATIFGSNLTSQNCMQSVSFVDTACGVKVLVNNQAQKLSYVSPTQINFLLPSATGNVSLVVNRSGVNGPAVNIALQDSSPAIFTQNSAGTGNASAQHWSNPKYKNGTFITATEPLEDRNTFIIYVTGLGSTRTSLGKKPTIKINNTTVNPASITFADKISPGLDQINITLMDFAALGVASGSKVYSLQVCSSVCSQTTLLHAKK